MKNAILTIVSLALLCGAAHAEKPTIGFDFTTTNQQRVSFEGGICLIAGNHVSIYGMVGATPFARKDGNNREITATASMYTLYKPWHCIRIGIIAGTQYEHLIRYAKGIDPDNPQRWLLGEIGMSIFFAEKENWALSLLYRRGITQTDSGTSAYGSHHVSIRLSCWVI
ncbi:MAG: hypothetical protein PHY34_03905 [Patescibacteria group bacterium]|nr:hypothetical protein [Patescibacteria group bacterium]